VAVPLGRRREEDGEMRKTKRGRRAGDLLLREMRRIDGLMFGAGNKILIHGR